MDRIRITGMYIRTRRRSPCQGLLLRVTCALPGRIDQHIPFRIDKGTLSLA